LPGKAEARPLMRGTRGGGASIAASNHSDGAELAKTVLAADTNIPSSSEISL